MARSCAAKSASAGNNQRRSRLCWRDHKQFKQRRKTRFTTKNLTLEVQEQQKSDGIWPILPYIVRTGGLSANSTSGHNLQTQEEKQTLKEAAVHRFNIFEKLVQDEKAKSAFELSTLGEESIFQSTKERADLDLTLVSKGNDSEGAEISKVSEEEEKKLQSSPSNSRKKEQSRKGSKQRLQNSLLNEASSSLSSVQPTDIEVITLTDDEDGDVNCLDVSSEFNESDVVLLDEVTNCSEPVASEPFKLPCSSSSDTVLQEMPPSTHKFNLLRKTLRHASFNSSAEKPSLKCLPRAEETTVFNDLLSKQAAKFFGRLIRHWEDVERNDTGGASFRICSYNVLCQDTMEKTGFLYRHLRCVIDWKKRSKLLSKEFVLINADILCLQEVQCLHYANFYQPFLKAIGYEGIYKKRTGDFVDGCAIFYRDRFQLLSDISIEYFVSNCTILDRDNVGQLVRLRDKETQKEFCVANTHLLYNAKRGDIKLAQLAILLAHLDQRCGPGSLKPCPYIMCGDFNISPFSTIYNFLLENHLSFENLHRNDMSGQGFHGGPLVGSNFMPAETNINRNCQFGEVSEASRKGNEWTHNLKFASVYRHVDAFNEAEVSSFNSEGAVNPDLMLYSVPQSITENATLPGSHEMRVCKNSLKLLRRLSLPNEKALKATLGPWPNKCVPSDHIPLVADFSLP